MGSSANRNNPHLPKPNNPRRRSVDHQLEWLKSNSTANLFLGGVAAKKPWMLDASSAAPTPATTTAAPTQAQPPVAAANSSHSSSVPILTAPAAVSTAASGSATVEEESSSGPQGMKNPPTNSASVSVPSRIQENGKEKNDVSAAPASASVTATSSVFMSPVIPGENLPRLLPSNPRSYPPTPSIVTSTIPTTSGPVVAWNVPQPPHQSQSSSLPSPDPSSASHPSPASIGDRNDGNLPLTVFPSPHPPPPAPGPMQVQLPPQQHPSQVRGTIPASAPPPTRRRGRRTAAPAPISCPQRQQMNATPQQAMAPTPNSGQQGPQSTASPAQQSPVSFVPPTPTYFIDRIFWQQLQAFIDAFLEETLSSTVLSETIEKPRMRLLRDACLSEDLFYLALHQIYCLYTYAPSEFARLPYMNAGQHLGGFEVIKQLLVDNHRVSGDFLRWSVHFPRVLPAMLRTGNFVQVLHDIANCLGLLSTKWAAFDRHVRERGYPPLIDELIVEFGATSSVLVSIMFLALSRRVHGPRHEDRLRSIFEENKRNYYKRFASRVTTAQMNRENEQLIRAYKELPRPAVSQYTSPTAGEQVSALHLPSHLGQPVFPPGTNGQVAYVAIPIPQMPCAPVTVPTSGRSVSIPHPAPATAPGGPGQAPHTGLGQTGVPSPQPPTASGSVSAPSTATPLSAPPLPVINQGLHHLPSRPSLPQPGPNIPYQAAISQPSGINPSFPLTLSVPKGFPLHVSPYPPQRTVLQSSPQHASPVSAGPPIQPPATQAQGQLQGGQQVQRPQRPQQVQQVQQVQRSQQSVAAPNLLLPPPGHLPTHTTRPHPLRVAIHQSHLRDPITNWGASGTAGGRESPLFNHMKSFAVSPTLLGKTETAFEWQFSLDGTEFKRLPQLHCRDNSQRPTRRFVDGSLVYRLRCIRVSPSIEEVSQYAWNAADTAWPDVMYIFVNGVEQCVRRKFHHGKDHPLEISNHLKEGLNTISVHLIRGPAESNDLLYALGVEIMAVTGLSWVRKLAKMLTASESRGRIQKRLSSGTADDELSIVSDYLIINLVDPFTARVFEIPARGLDCKHLECFDFETFLMTRSSNGGKATTMESWRCPICGTTAHPHDVIIDGFLMEVHAELQRTNRLDGAKAIKIKADGSWELKDDGGIRPLRMVTEQTQNVVSLKRKQDGSTLSSPPAQRPKTEGVGQESHAFCESSIPEVIEID